MPEMIGLGSLVYVVNVLPFAYLIVSPLVFRRYNFLGMNPHHNSRNYYKRFWFRALFGRFQIQFFGVGGSLALLYFFQQKNNENAEVLEFTSFLDEIEDFQEEASDEHAKQLAQYKYKKSMIESSDLVFQRRAELHREMKIKAFNEFVSEEKI